MSLKPITLWSHRGGPNPWKVSIILEELNLPYNQHILDLPDMKKEPYTSLNPNGRVPTIQDPNTGITLWESCAIMEYLVSTYDKDHNISFVSGTIESFEAKQWLFYQASGQGPYFGQAIWFNFHHPEKVPSAVDRYVNEIKRVCSVMNDVLMEREYLVGGKYSYVDASFLPWYESVFDRLADRFSVERDYPALFAWLERIKMRPAVAKTIQDRRVMMEAK